MASGIGSISDVVRVIQSQLAAAPARRPRAGADAAASAGAGRYAPENLASLIESRVRAIGRDDPQRGRKAFRVFLEAVLLSHFGEALINDPRFFQMVDDVQTTLEADAACRDMIATAIGHLLAPAP